MKIEAMCLLGSYVAASVLEASNPSETFSLNYNPSSHLFSLGVSVGSPAQTSFLLLDL